MRLRCTPGIVSSNSGSLGDRVRPALYLFYFAALAGCNASDTPSTGDLASQDEAHPSCTTDLAAWPIRVKIVGELEKIGTGTLCEGARESAAENQPLHLDGMTLSLGTPIDAIYSSARNAGGTIANTFAGKAVVFEDAYDLDARRDQPWASQKATETRRYWLNEDDGKLIGFRACITYGEGGYRNQLNEALADAFGPPQYIKTVAKISWAPELRMEWKNGATFRTSNDPNTARADFGEIPTSFNWNDAESNISLYRDLVKREDAFGREDFWIAQMKVAQENCFIDGELKDVVQPLLEAGISPD